MGHSHAHERADFGRAFAIGVTLNLAFVILELIYGRISGSLVLVTDAVHNFGDVLGLGLAWVAMVLGRRQPTAKRTYGFRRSSILAALLNAGVLLISVGAIVWEAVGRLQDSHPVAETTVIWVAALGILINGGTALPFLAGKNRDLNIRAAFSHLVSDAFIALGVVLTGVAMLYTGLLWLDPAASIVIAVLITYGTWGLLRDSANLALDAVPAHIDIAEVKDYLGRLSSCTDVHDLHVWGMSTTESALTAHVVVDKAVCDDAFLAQAAYDLHDKFGIEHTTLQVEFGDSAEKCGCRMA